MKLLAPGSSGDGRADESVVGGLLQPFVVLPIRLDVQGGLVLAEATLDAGRLASVWVLGVQLERRVEHLLEVLLVELEVFAALWLGLLVEGRWLLEEEVIVFGMIGLMI